MIALPDGLCHDGNDPRRWLFAAPGCPLHGLPRFLHQLLRKLSHDFRFGFLGDACGKQDGGDALELTTRVTQEAKPEVMRKLAQQLVQEAREAMERAAWRGEEPSAWVVAIMTEAGWERYYALRAEASSVGQAQAAPETAR